MSDPMQRDNEEKKKRKRQIKDMQPRKRAASAHEFRHSAVEQTTVQYFVEVKHHFDDLDDLEEKRRLVENALEEVKGREVEIATDATCSRVLEVFLSHAPASTFFRFCRAFLDNGKFSTISRSPFGSRVVEKLMAVLADCLIRAEDEDAAKDILSEIVTEITGDLYDFVMDRNASHVVRRLLCVIAGRNLIDGKSKGRAESDFGSKRNEWFNLGAKVNAREADHGIIAEGVAHPDLLDIILDKLCSSESLMAKLVLQILRANVAKDSSDSKVQELNDELISAMAHDPNASHLLEAFVLLSPESLKSQIVEMIFDDNLSFLAMHRHANFVVQAALGACTNRRLVKSAVKQLKELVPQLLWQERAGVVLALVAASLQTKAGQKALGEAVISAINQHVSEADEGLTKKGLVSLLMMGLPDLSDVRRHAHLSAVGCAMFARLLAYPQGVAQAFILSLGSLSADELVKVACDGAGSWVVEAFLDCKGDFKPKQKLIRKLVGHYKLLAASPGGCHVVEKCFDLAGMKQKEIIVKELMHTYKHAADVPRMQHLFRRCKLETYKQNPELWRSCQKGVAMQPH